VQVDLFVLSAAKKTSGLLDPATTAKQFSGNLENWSGRVDLSDLSTAKETTGLLVPN
jgi:hypothetical protein